MITLLNFPQIHLFTGQMSENNLLWKAIFTQHWLKRSRFAMSAFFKHLDCLMHFTISFSRKQNDHFLDQYIAASIVETALQQNKKVNKLKTQNNIGILRWQTKIFPFCNFDSLAVISGQPLKPVTELHFDSTLQVEI